MAQTKTFSAVAAPGSYGPTFSCSPLRTLTYTVVGTIDAACSITLQRSTDGYRWETVATFNAGVQDVSATLVPEVNTFFRFHAIVPVGHTMTSMAVSIDESAAEPEGFQPADNQLTTLSGLTQAQADAIRALTTYMGTLLAADDADAAKTILEVTGGTGGTTGEAVLASETPQDVFDALGMGDVVTHDAADFDAAGSAATAQSAADAAQSTADGAASTASAAASAASNAQSTADAAQTAADNAAGAASSAASAASDAVDAANYAINQAAAAQTAIDAIPVMLTAQFIAPIAGMKWKQVICFEATLSHWILWIDTAGAIEFDVKVNGTTMIGAGNAPLLVSGPADRAALSGWGTVTLSPGDLLEFVVVSVTGPTQAHIGLQGTYGI